MGSVGTAATGAWGADEDVPRNIRISCSPLSMLTEAKLSAEPIATRALVGSVPASSFIRTRWLMTLVSAEARVTKAPMI